MSIQSFLHSQVLTSVVSRQASASHSILAFMGMNPGGANEIYLGHGREGSYHVYDKSRKSAKGRAPGTAAGRSNLQGMKAVAFTYPRMHDSKAMPAEWFNNLGRIDNPAQRDIAGQEMLRRQTATQALEAANWRAAMVVGMLKDSLYFHIDGDDYYVDWSSSGSAFPISFNVPASQKSQLNMTDRGGTSVHGGAIVDASWATASTDIPLHFAKIDQARAATGIGPVKHVLINSTIFELVKNNTKLIAQAGSSNPPFLTFEQAMVVNDEGLEVVEKVATFIQLPGITFHISDEGLELGAPGAETFQKYWPANTATFMGDPQREDTFSLYLGSEPIAEYDGGPETVREGLAAWSTKTANPTATNIFVLDNSLPVNHDPFAVQHATVVF